MESDWGSADKADDGAGAAATIACTQCEKKLRSVASLRKHAATAHGYRIAARALVLDDQCPACLQHFGTRPRALRHAWYDSKLCREWVERHRPA
eukprot:4045392-Lingulodinium_polyedra.AAC.1